MFRLVEQPLSFRHRVQELVYKMLFLWSKKPEPTPPRSNPWVAWLTTAIVLWGCRRRILKTILALSPLRIFKNLNIKKSRPITKTRATSSSTNSTEGGSKNSSLHPKQHTTGIKTRVKRLGTGDGPHISNCTTVMQTTQQVHYRMTRSGRIYGRYPHKIAASM